MQIKSWIAAIAVIVLWFPHGRSGGTVSWRHASEQPMQNAGHHRHAQTLLERTNLRAAWILPSASVVLHYTHSKVFTLVFQDSVPKQQSHVLTISTFLNWTHTNKHANEKTCSIQISDRSVSFNLVTNINIETTSIPSKNQGSIPFYFFCFQIFCLWILCRYCKNNFISIYFKHNCIYFIVIVTYQHNINQQKSGHMASWLFEFQLTSVEL